MSEPSRIIPYCVPNTGEPRTFTSDMQLAYVALLAESRKRVSRLLHKKTEKLVYVKKIEYPLILAPLGERTAVFDGLELTNTICELPSLPPLELLMDEILGSTTSRSKISTTLRGHEKLLRLRTENNKISLRGLVSELELLEDLMKSLQTEALPNDATTPLPYVLTLDEASKRANELQTTIFNFTVHLNGLSHLAELIGSQIARIEDKTKKEIKSATADYDSQISKLRAEVERNVILLERKLEEELERINQKKWKTVEKLTREKDKMESKLDNLANKLDTANGRYQKVKRLAGKKMLRKRIDELEKEANHIRKDINQIQAEIATIRRHSEVQERHLRKETTSKIRTERERVMKIENEERLFISVCEEELQNLKLRYDSVSHLIESHCKRIEKQLKRIQDNMLPKLASVPSKLLLTIYCAKYQNQNHERHVFFPPCSPQMKKRVSQRIEHAILGSRTKLEAIGAPIGNGLRKFAENLGKAFFKSAILKNAIESKEIPNILTEEFRQSIHTGINRLIHEGWITSKDIGYAQEMLNQI